MASDRQKGAVLSYVSVILSMILSLVYTPFLLQKLGQSEYGLFSLVNTVMSYLTMLDFGLGNTIVRYTAKYRELGDRKKEYSVYGMFLTTYILIGVIALLAGSVIAFNASTIFAKTLEAGQESKITLMILIAVVNVALSFPLSIFTFVVRGYEKFAFSNLMNLIRKVLTPLTMIGILFAGHGSVAILLGTAIINMLFNLVKIYYCLTHLRIKVSLKGFDKPVFREIVVFSSFTFIAVIADKLFWSTDQIVLGIVGDSMNNVAVYALAAVFIANFITVTSIIGHMYLPKFTKMVTAGESDEKISDEFIRISRLQFYICMIIFGGFLVVGYRFITELYASYEYVESYFIAIIVMSAVALEVSLNVALSVLQAKNMHKRRAFIYCLSAVVNVILSIVAIYFYGAMGAAVVTFFSYFFCYFVPMCVYYQKKVRLNVTGLLKQFGISGGKYLVLIAVFFLLNELVGKKLSIIPYFFSFGTAFVICYCVVTYCLCMNENEKNFVSRIFKKVLSKIKH